MRISDNEIKKIMGGDNALVEAIVEIGQDNLQREADARLIKQVTKDVIAMEDRDDMVAEIKARIDSGQYNPTGDEIADAMIRRSIADSVR